MFMDRWSTPSMPWGPSASSSFLKHSPLGSALPHSFHLSGHSTAFIGHAVTSAPIPPTPPAVNFINRPLFLWTVFMNHVPGEWKHLVNNLTLCCLLNFQAPK